MTRDTNDELLLTMLFFGFLLLTLSLGLVSVRAAFPSPKAGAVDDLVLALDSLLTLLLLVLSIEIRGSLLASSGSFISFTLLVSCLPKVLHRNRLLVAVLVL